MSLHYLDKSECSKFLHATLFAIKGSNNKKQTKQRKSSEIKHCKISQTQQDNTIQY